MIFVASIITSSLSSLCDLYIQVFYLKLLTLMLLLLLFL